MSELHEGHRARLKNRLMQSSLGSMAEYETLELILCLAIPRKDVKDLAKTLLKKFKSLGAVLAAEPEILMQVPGIGPAVISTFRIFYETVAQVTKEQIVNSDIMSNMDKVVEYLRSTMGYCSTEQLRILYLNNKNRLMADELHDYGTINSVSIYPREIVKKTVYHCATSLILVHNHPSGNILPSEADIKLTKLTAQALNSINAKLMDHIIISSNSHYSFRAHSLIN